MQEENNQINWSPASSFGANFCTHKLSNSSSSKLEFKPTIGMKLFYLVFCFMTLIVPIVFFGGVIAGEVPLYALLMCLSVAILFLYVCKILKKMAYAPNYFDKTTDTYYALEPGFFGVDKEIKEAISSIEALQILPKTMQSSKNRYTSYELNLLLKSGERRTVLSHASYKDIKQDAQTISMHFGFNILEKEN